MAYTKVTNLTGCALYRSGSIYVQEIDLTRARIILAHGGIGKPQRFKFRSLRVYFRALRQAFGSDAFSVVNGAFWKVGENPARLALPLKIDGVIVSEGFDRETYIVRGKAALLELYPGRAVIRDMLSYADFTGSDAPNIITGLNWTASRRKMEYTGRTVIGIRDEGKMLCILSSGAARQNQAKKILRDEFGCSSSLMFDGGGSSQMICKDVTYVASSRAIPQVIEVVSGHQGYNTFVPNVFG